MEKRSKRKRPFASFLIIILLVLVGLFCYLFFFEASTQILLKQEWEKLSELSGRLLGWEKRGIPLEEQRIREEVIFKKMEEASASRDWKAFAKEYPRLKRLETLSEEGKNKSLKDSPAFKEIEKELKEYLKKKEDIFNIDPPLHSLKEEEAIFPIRDRADEKIIEGLLSKKESVSSEKPLEENLILGIKGPLVSRKILVRPQPPSVKIGMEGEIELNFWVLPDGRVDRIIPTIKGDTELERIAIQYLKQWRFAPIPKDQPQVEQWGTIPIRFKLR